MLIIAILPTAPPTSPTPSGRPTSLPRVIDVPPVAKVILLKPLIALAGVVVSEALKVIPAPQETVIPESVVVDKPKDTAPPWAELLFESADW